MRKTAIFLIALCSTVWGAVSSTAQTADLLVIVTDFGQASNLVRAATLTPLARTLDRAGVIMLPQPVTYSVSNHPELTNGIFTFTNYATGYALKLDLSTTYAVYSYTSSPPTNVSGTVNFTTYGGIITGIYNGVCSFAYFNIGSGSNTNAITNNQSGVTLPGLSTAAGYGNVPFATNTAGGGYYEIYGGDGSLLAASYKLPSMATNAVTATNTPSGRALNGLIGSATNVSVTFAGSATGSVSIVNNVLTGTIGASNAVTGSSIASNSVSTYFADTNALSFCNAAGVTDISVRADAVGFYNELQMAGIGSNLVDAVLFQPRFNPSNALTFFRRAILETNALFYKWGASMTNSGSPFTANVVGLPDCTTNTMIFVWHAPNILSDGNNPGRILGGLINPQTIQSLQITGNGAANSQAHIRQGGNENAFAGGNEQAAWLIPWTIYNYDSSKFNRLQGLMTSGNKLVTGMGYDGSNIVVWQDWWPAMIDYNNKTTITNYALAPTPVRIVSGLTNLFIGRDFISTNTIGASKADLLEVLIFNKVLSYTEYKAALRAIRWLDPDDEDIFIGGDSQMSVDGTGAESLTNAPILFIKQYYDTKQDRVNVFDVSMQGDSYYGWTPYSGSLNNFAFKTNSNFVSTDFRPNGKVKKRTFLQMCGINDIYSAGNSGAQVMSNVLWLAANCASNGVSYIPFTIRETSTNGSAYPQTAANETSRTYYNLAVVTNAYQFEKVILADTLGNQSLMNTNNGYTKDGLHMSGTNGIIQNKRLAVMTLGSAPNPTTIFAISNPTNSYTTGVTYLNYNTRAFLSGSAVLNSAVAGSANITLFYTNNGIGYQQPMQAGAGVAMTDYVPFGVPLAPNATFQFISTMGTGASGYITNVVNWQQQ